MNDVDHDFLANVYYEGMHGVSDVDYCRNDNDDDFGPVGDGDEDVDHSWNDNYVDQILMKKRKSENDVFLSKLLLHS